MKTNAVLVNIMIYKHEDKCCIGEYNDLETRYMKTNAVLVNIMI